MEFLVQSGEFPAPPAQLELPGVASMAWGDVGNREKKKGWRTLDYPGAMGQGGEAWNDQ